MNQKFEGPALTTEDRWEHTNTADFIGISKSILTPLIREWLIKNQHIDLNVRLVYMTSAIVDFGTSFLQKPILVPTW